MKKIKIGQGMKSNIGTSYFLRISYIIWVLMMICYSSVSYTQNMNSLGRHHFMATESPGSQSMMLSYNEFTEKLEYSLGIISGQPYAPLFSTTFPNAFGIPSFYYTGKFMISIQDQDVATINKLRFNHGLGERDHENWAHHYSIGPHAFPKTSLLLPTSNPSEYLLVHSGIKVWQNDTTVFDLSAGSGLAPYRPETFTLPDIYDDFMKHDTYSDGIMATKFTINPDGSIEVSEELDELRIGFGRYRTEIIGCKQANGRDWWILAPKITHNLMSVFSYDLNEITYIGEFPLSEGNTYSNPLLGSFVFSPDGSKLLRTHRRIHYAYGDPDFLGPDDILEIWEFDRCTGSIVGDPMVINFPRPKYFDDNPDKNIPFRSHHMRTIKFRGPSYLSDVDFVNFAGCFSEDGSKVYIANGVHVIQLDLDNDLQKDTLFTYDDVSKTVELSPNNPFSPFPTLPDAFWYLPNGKIVVGSNNMNSAVHMIHNPNLPGSQCDFEFEALRFENTLQDPESSDFLMIRGLPTFPHYDMTAIDNHEVFCDKEAHDPPVESTISVGPNPFSNEVTVFIPFEGFYTLSVFDLLGRNLYLQNIPSPMESIGSIQIETSHLPVGVYIVVVEDLVSGERFSFKILKKD